MKEVRKDVIKTTYRVKPKYDITYEAIQYDGHNAEAIEDFLNQSVEGEEEGVLFFENDRAAWDDTETMVKPGQFIVKAYDTYHVVDSLEGEDYRIVEKVVEERHYYMEEGK